MRAFSSNRVNADLSQNLQQLKKVEEDLNSIREGKPHKLFGKTLSGAKSLEKKELALAKRVLEQSHEEGNSSGAKRVAEIAGRAFHRIESKTDVKKYEKQRGELKTLLSKSDHYIVNSSLVEQITLSQLQGEEKVSREMFSQKAFNEPGYKIQVPYKGEVIEATGLEAGEDGKVEASGAEGRVFFGEHQGRRLAFKLQRLTEENSANVESEIAQSVKMNGLPHLLGTEHAIKVDEEYVLIIMERAEEGALFQSLSESLKAELPQEKEQILSQKDRIRLVKEAAIGVREMHKMGLIHLDIKLENIVLKKDEEGVVRAYIIDFGFTSYEGNEGLNRGTPGYYAPEITSKTGKIRGAADVFSLGMVLHMAVTDGYTVIREEDGKVLTPKKYKKAMKHQTSYPVDGKVFRNRLTNWVETAEGLARVVRRSITRNPQERMTIDEFISELQELENECK